MEKRRVEWKACGATSFVEQDGSFGFNIGVGKVEPSFFLNEEAPQLINAIAEVCGLSVAIGEDTVIATTAVPFSHEGLQSQIDQIERWQDNHTSRITTLEAEVAANNEAIGDLDSDLSKRLLDLSDDLHAKNGVDDRRVFRPGDHVRVQLNGESRMGVISKSGLIIIDRSQG